MTSPVAKTKVQWTDENQYQLLALVMAHKAHIKTIVKMSDKWENVTNEFERYLGCTIQLTSEGLKAKFKRILEAVSLEYGITNEAANLSRLDETPPRLHSLALDLAQQIYKQVEVKDAEKVKENKRIIGMTAHEGSIIKSQV
jgi:hypothetical protein